MGYPFPSVKATYDPAASPSFKFTEMHLPLFPIEGIYTRYFEVGKNPVGYRTAFIETSSPGLKGQSGGPIIDTKGLVWGIRGVTDSPSLSASTSGA